MKKIILWIVGALLLVGLIAGASVIYNNYMEENKQSNVVIVGGKDESSAQAPVEGETEQGSGEQTADKGEEAETDSPYLAPDFTFYTLDGKAVKLSDFRGKPIVMNFWASGCYYCVEEMPHFQEAYEKYGDEVVFLMIDCIGFFGETLQTGSEFMADKGYTFPVYYDTQNNAVGVYVSGSLPYTFFIDRNFDLYTYIPGMADAETLEECIGLILK